MWIAAGLNVHTAEGRMIRVGDEALAKKIADAINALEQNERLVNAAVAVLARHRLLVEYGEELAKKRGDNEVDIDGQAAAGGGDSAQSGRDTGNGADGCGGGPASG